MEVVKETKNDWAIKNENDFFIFLFSQFFYFVVVEGSQT